MTHSKQLHLNSLTSIRFPAMIIIVIYHLSEIQGLTWAPLWLDDIVGLGYVMVTFFFFLSGFVLAYSYADKEFDFRRFWRTRFIRLYPIYLFSLIVAAPIFFNDVAILADKVPAFAWVGQHMGIAISLVLVMCQAWVPQATPAVNGVAWFVSALIFFYALFPFLLKWFKRLSSRNLIFICVIAWLFSQGLAIIYLITSPDGVSNVGSDDFLFWLTVLKMNPLVRLPEFIIGMLCGLWFLRNRQRRTLATPLVFFGVVFILITIAIHHSIPYPLKHTGFFVPAFAAIILGLAFQPAWSKPLEWRPLITLGQASYALFLLHLPILEKWLFVDSMPPTSSTPGNSMIGVGITIIAALLAYWVIEKPARKWLSRKSKRGKMAEQRI